MNEEINPETLSLYMQLVGKMYAKTLSYDLEFTNLERYYLILWAIDEGYEQLTQQNLSDLFKVDKAAMVRIVDDLTKKGFIERTENPHDKRAYYLALTRKGRRVIPEIREAIQNLNEEAMLDFTPHEKEQFLDMLHRVYQNLVHLPESDFLLNFDALKKEIQERDA